MVEETGVPGRPAGAARIAGDDYQHLVTWNEVLLALRTGSDVTHITVEAPEAGNLDDVVVEHADAPTDYTQVKHAVDAQTPVGTDYLHAPGRGTTERGQRSLLQRFRDTWFDIRERGEARMQLVTDREIDPGDPLLARLDRRSECLYPAVYVDGLPKPVIDVRRQWAQHLDVDEDILASFLADLRLRTGRPYQAEEERADAFMWGHGWQVGSAALAAGVGFVRKWVQQNRRRLNIDELREQLAGVVEQVRDPGALLVVEAIDDDLHPEDADELLRWVERYNGDDADSRRQLHDPSDWTEVVGPQIEAAGQRLRAAGHRRIIVRGALRLPVWFAVGAALRHVHGFDVAALQRGEIWASETAGNPRPPHVGNVDVGAGDHVAIAISITRDMTNAVRGFISAADLPVGRLVVLQPPGGAGPQAIPDGAAAATLAVALRDSVIDELDEHPADHIHLFLAAPGGVGLLLGHRWNALRPTTIYEHLGAGRGYARTVTVSA